MIEGAADIQEQKRAVAITVDIETDWGGRLKPGSDSLWGVRKGLPMMIEILSTEGIKCTFFVSAEVVSYIVHELRQLVKAGHEIASHGFCHRSLSYLSKKELHADVLRSKSILEETFDIDVRGFRSPQGRLHEDLFNVLTQSDYVYDSSMLGVFFPGRYNNRSLPSTPFRHEGVIEIPGTVLPWLRIPMGLLWINLLGRNIWQWLLRGRRLPGLINFYSHPFDVLTEKTPFNGNLPLRAWYSIGANRSLDTFRSFIRYMKLRGARFVTLIEVCAEFKG